MSSRTSMWSTALLLSSLLLGGQALTGCSKSEAEAQPDTVPAKGGEKKGDPDQPSSLATAEASATARTGRPGDADELSAMSMPSPADCVRKCVEQNQMRAEGADKIAADCQERCRGACEKRCAAEAAGRPSSFADQCKTDCQQQVGDTSP